MPNLTVLKDSSEIVHYNDPAIPLFIARGRVSFYTNLTSLCHWHDDIEYIGMIKGHMAYNINGEKVMIHENDSLLINSRQMHYCYSDDGTDNEFYCIVFKPQILTSNQELLHRYIERITENPAVPYFYLDSSKTEHRNIISIMNTLYRLKEENSPGFELTVLSRLNLFWNEWFTLLQPYIPAAAQKTDKDIDTQKAMVRFIYSNYMLRITLDDIAASGNVCKSSCCRIFRRYFNKTPNDFLNSYRLEESMNLLPDRTKSITDISYSCGFTSPSYYSELFLQYKGCTPTCYRESHT